MKALVFLMHAGAAALLLSAPGCKQHGDEAMRETKFPGMVTAGGGTSGQVMARNGGPKTDATYAGGTPGIAGGAGGNTAGAGTGGRPAKPGRARATAYRRRPAAPRHRPAPPRSRPATAATTRCKPDAGQAPQPAAAHRDPGANSAAPGR
jgi:hypothetical protein